MKFEIEKFKVDIGTTEIENMFIDNYLIKAPGDAIKVYLYAMKNIQEGTLNIDTNVISRTFNMTENEVKIIWDYWEKVGIIKREKDKIVFMNLRQLYIDQFSMSNSQENPSEEPDEVDKMLEQFEQVDNKNMFNQIEKMLGTILNYNEMEKIITSKSDFQCSEDLIVRAFDVSINKLNRKDFHYSLGVLRKWSIAGVHNIEELEAHIKILQEKKKPNKGKFNTDISWDNNAKKNKYDDMAKKKMDESRKKWSE